MILSWLTGGLWGARRWIWLVGATALVIGAVVALRAAEDADDKRNVELGKAAEREAVSRAVLENVEKANEARDEIRRDVDGARYAECLQSARTPANCERFLPQ